jgi:hypothetical protein
VACADASCQYSAVAQIGKAPGETLIKDASYALLCRKKSRSEGPLPRPTSFSANCSRRLKKGSLSGSVCADPDVLAAPGVGWSYGVGMLSMGSNVWLDPCCSGLGVGARLASCGNGENEKFGENGRLRLPRALRLLLLFVSLLLVPTAEEALGGVKGGRDIWGC